LVPAVCGGDDAVGVGGPGERLWAVVVFGQVTIDGGLEVDEGIEDAALQSPAGQFGKNPSTALSQDAEVGVKWKVQRWRASHALTLGCLWLP
jgi:hypothetical protein